MQRGILTLTKDEISAVLSRVEEVMISQLVLINKFKAAAASELDEVHIEVSADDLEYILDEIAVLTTEESSPALLEARKKLQNLLVEFRQQEIG